jgi:hypothetical protein
MDGRWMIVIASTIACGPTLDDDDANGSGDGMSQCREPEPTLSLLLGPTPELAQELPCETSLVVGASVTLSCDDPSLGEREVTLGWVASPDIELALDVGTEVLVKTLSLDPIPADEVVRPSVFVHDAQTNELVLAAIYGHDQSWIDELAPLSVEPIDVACPYGAEPGDCLVTGRMMWEVRSGDDVAIVGDATRTDVGEHVVHVQRAYRGRPDQCSDDETEFYELLIARRRS